MKKRRILLGPIRSSEMGGQYLRRALANHSVITFAEQDADITYDYSMVTFDQILSALPEGWQPDLVLIWSPEYQGLPLGFERCPFPIVGAIGDWNMSFRCLKELAGAFDHLFTDQRGTERFRQAGIQNVDQALLFGFDPKSHYRMLEEKKLYDVTLIGNMNPDVHGERARWAAKLAPMTEHFCVKLFSGVYGEDYTRLLNQSKITFNRSIRGEMNMRAYEAPACGSLLFYEEENTEVHQVFEDGKHCVLYNEENLIERLTYFLTHDAEREKIVDAAYERVQSFRYEDQLERLLQKIEALGLFDSTVQLPRSYSARPAKEQIQLRAWQAFQSITPDHLEASLNMLSEQLPTEAMDHQNLAVASLSAAAQTPNTEAQNFLIQQAASGFNAALNREEVAPIAEANCGAWFAICQRFDEAEQSLLRSLQSLEGCAPETLWKAWQFPYRFDRFRVEIEQVASLHANVPTRFAEVARGVWRWQLLKSLGELYASQGDLAQMIQAYRYAVDNLQDGGCWYSLGLALEKVGHLEAALMAVEQAIENQPFLMEAHEFLAQLYLRLDQEAQAMDRARLALRIIALYPALEGWRERFECLLPNRSAKPVSQGVFSGTDDSNTPHILTFNWHEPFLCSVFKTGHHFSVITPDVLGVQRIDNNLEWDYSKRPLPSNAQLLTTINQVQEGLRQRAYHAALCFTLHDLSSLREVAIPKLFCPISSPRNDLGDQYENRSFREAYLRHIQDLTRDALIVYVSDQMAHEEFGGYGLPGVQISKVASIDPDDYTGYTGERAAVLRVGSLLKERWFLNFGIQQQVLDGFPHKILGVNPDLPGASPAKNWDDLRQHYREYRLFFNSYHKRFQETSAQMSLLEAMLTGMPIVATDHPLSVIQDGVQGFVSDDIPTLRARIQQLFDDPNLARQLGQQARQKAIEIVQFPAFLEGWNRVIQQSIEEYPSRLRDSSVA